MSKPRKKREEAHEEGPSAERWLLTYADMITLLMVLFIVLFAMGQTDIRKFNAFKDSFHQLTTTLNNTSPQGGPGILSQPSAIALTEQNPMAQLKAASANNSSGEKTIGTMASGQSKTGQQQSGQKVTGQAQSGKTVQGQQKGSGAVARKPALTIPRTPAEERAALTKAAEELEKALEKKGLEDDVSVSLSQDGLVVSILTDKVLFPLGSAVLQPTGVEVIDAIAPVLGTLPNLIDVEGDTDNTPVHGGPYGSNWALSAARAVSVVTDLVNVHDINPDQLQATGYGDTRPVVPNDTAQHRAENRRVEIVIFSTTDTP